MVLGKSRSSYVSWHACARYASYAGIGILLISAALAHSWYPQECCGGNDCFEIDDSRVHVVPGGYLVDGRHFVPEAKARIAKEGGYHACFYPTPNDLHCFFKPPMGS